MNQKGIRERNFSGTPHVTIGKPLTSTASVLPLQCADGRSGGGGGELQNAKSVKKIRIRLIKNTEESII